MKSLIIALGLVVSLGACSTADEDRKENSQEAVDAVHKPLHQAKQVEQQIFDNDLERRRELDDL